MLKSPICISLGVILVVVLKQCLCQVCHRNVLVEQTYQKPYQHTYKERYRDNCWYGSCTKTRTRSVTEYRTLTKHVIKEVKECCSGYLEEDGEDSNGDTIVCNPICMPACSKNSKCTSPGACTCYDGYTKNSPRSCTPVCSKPCHHGTCIAPETCQCDFGYNNSTGKCEPICTEPCTNGICTLPDTCECNTGYRKSESNNCEPYCSNGCTNGRCVSPETCECNQGYMHNGNNLCIPNCAKDCGHGSCIAPDICECEPGYVVVNGTCRPVCSNNCVNGICVAPETCDCDPGYTLINKICQPICNGCVNGKCVFPNICQCDHGYNASIATCKPICRNCEDNVLCPYNDCVLCDSDNEDDDSEECEDCSIDCYVKDVKCEFTECVRIPESMTETTSEESKLTDANYLDEELNPEEATDNRVLLTSADYDKDTLNTKSYVDNEIIETNQQKGEGNKFPVYLTYVIAIATIMIVLAIILVVKRKSLGYCSGGSYVIDESRKSPNSSRPSTSFDMRFSTIQKSDKERN